MEALEPIPENELLTRALQGDENAFRVLYERFKQGIFRYGFYMTNSQTAAEEVTQETFITLIEKGSTFNPAQADLGAFIFGLARNIVRRVSRRERLYHSLLNDEPVDEQQDDAASAPESMTLDLIRDQRAASLRAAIAELPEQYRQAVVLCDLFELSYAEAAARLECPVGTVRSRLHRGHALLAQKLKLVGDAEATIRRAGAEGCLT